MNEYQATKEYLDTLRQVYQEKGFVTSVKHEVVATLGSMMGRIIRLNNYSVSLFDLVGDPISFRDVWKYNTEIKRGRLENLLNKDLTSTSWVPANWTEA